MKIIEKYTGEKTYMFPNGSLATPEAMLAQFPAVLTFAHIIGDRRSGRGGFAVQNLSAMRSLYGIDNALGEAEAIEAIQTIVNTPEEVNTEPSTEERTAAALEFIAMSSLPDKTI